MKSLIKGYRREKRFGYTGLAAVSCVGFDTPQEPFHVLYRCRHFLDSSAPDGKTLQLY
jgi:hypothetical protein